MLQFQNDTSAGASCLSYGPLRIEYDATVLEPRPWTRSQAVWGSFLLTELPPGPVLELCTGAGHIGLLAVHGHDRDLVAVDASAEACAWARVNAATNGIRAEVRHGEMGSVLAPEEKFALVIADPPWVRRDEVSRYPEDPLLAIDGGADGLDLARECVRLAGAHLVTGGSALLQLGTAEQVEALGPVAEENGLNVEERLIVPGRGVVVHLRRR